MRGPCTVRKFTFHHISVTVEDNGDFLVVFLMYQKQIMCVEMISFGGLFDRGKSALETWRLSVFLSAGQS